MTEEQRQHLNFIQNSITRMNTNSFQVKALAITIISALLAVYASNNNILFILLGFIPTFIFWFLDAYYLQQERKFRGIYNDASGITSQNKLLTYEMPLDKYRAGKYNYLSSFGSKTVILIYIPIFLMLLIISGIILWSNAC